MGAIASQITSLTIVYSTVYSDADQRKHQSSASLAIVWRIHRSPVNSPHKWPVTRKMFPFDDVIEVTYTHLIYLLYACCWPGTVGCRGTNKHFDRLVQEIRISSALAMGLRLSCTKPIDMTVVAIFCSGMWCLKLSPDWLKSSSPHKTLDNMLVVASLVIIYANDYKNVLTRS